MYREKSGEGRANHGNSVSGSNDEEIKDESR